MTKANLTAMLDEADRLHTIALDDNTPEDVSDAAYADFWATCQKIAAWIVSFTMGRIDENTAMRMAVHKRGELLALTGRWAA